MVALSAFGCKGLTLLSVDGLGTAGPRGAIPTVHRGATQSCFPFAVLSDDLPFPPFHIGHVPPGTVWNSHGSTQAALLGATSPICAN